MPSLLKAFIVKSNQRNSINEEMKRLVQSHYALTHRGEENYIGAVPIFLEVQREYEAIATTILNFPIYRERFAFEDIAERLKSVVTGTVRSGDYQRAVELMDQLWKRLENADERKVCYVPIMGVKLATRMVEIGRFRLHQMDEPHIDEAVQLLNASLDNTTNTVEQKHDMKALLGRELSEYLSETVCLRIEVSADTKKADQIALRDAVTLLDLFRLTIPALYSKSRNIAVGLKGDGQPGIYRRYVLPLGKSDGFFPSYRTGPFGELELNDDAIQKMGRLGVVKIATVNGGVTALQNAILRSIHWFAESQLQRTQDNELVNLVIALESLFELEHGSKQKTDKVCEAAAVLVKSDERSRSDVFLRLRNASFYRGEVVHQGDDVSDYQDMDAVRAIVQAVIAKVIHRMDEFRTPKDVLAWVDKQGAGVAKVAKWKRPTLRSAPIANCRITPAATTS